MDSLSGVTPGNPDNGYERLFQFGTQTLSSGGVLGLGDGTDTLLYLDNAGIGVKNGGGFLTKLQTLAASTRTVSFADADGRLFPALVAVLASDATESAGTPTTVSSWAITLEASATYEFEILLILSSAGATTSPKWTLTGPTAQTDFVAYETRGIYVTQAGFSAFGTAGTNAANPPAANTPYSVLVRGVIKTTATTPATNVELQLFTETAATAVTLKAGSIMKFRKLS